MRRFGSRAEESSIVKVPEDHSIVAGFVWKLDLEIPGVKGDIGGFQGAEGEVEALRYQVLASECVEAADGINVPALRTCPRTGQEASIKPGRPCWECCEA